MILLTYFWEDNNIFKMLGCMSLWTSASKYIGIPTSCQHWYVQVSVFKEKEEKITLSQWLLCLFARYGNVYQWKSSLSNSLRGKNIKIFTWQNRRNLLCFARLGKVYLAPWIGKNEYILASGKGGGERWRRTHGDKWGRKETLLWAMSSRCYWLNGTHSGISVLKP